VVQGNDLPVCASGTPRARPSDTMRRSFLLPAALLLLGMGLVGASALPLIRKRRSA